MKVLVFLFIVLCFGNSALTAQNESGVRSLDSSSYAQAGYWMNSSNSMFQLSLPIITSIPPLNSGMPLDILVSYIATDSLLRFRTRIALDSTLISLPGLNDTIRNAAKYLFRMNDYNPLIFNQYAGEVAINNISQSGGRYKASLIDLKANVAWKVAETISASKKHAFFSLLYSDYILCVRIESIDSITDKRRIVSMEPSTTKRYRVCATVLDTIKGKIFPGATCSSQTLVESTQTESSTINFQYLKSMYWPHNPDPNGFTIQNDTAFSDASGKFEMSPGQECIVFLKLQNQLYNYESDYFDLDVQPMCSNGVLPIEQGKVRDINLFWTSNATLTYSAWQTAVDAMISDLMSLSF